MSELRTYEALYIVRPDLEDEEVETVSKAVESLVTEQGGAILQSEIWGKRRLAYNVEKFVEGRYVLLRFEADATFVARLKEYFRLADAVIRHLVTHFDEKTLRLEASQKERKEAELRKTAVVAARAQAAVAARRERAEAELGEERAETASAEAAPESTPEPEPEPEPAEPVADEGPALEGDAAQADPE